MGIQIISPKKRRDKALQLQIGYGIYQTAFGTCLIATTEVGICTLYFLDITDENDIEEILQADWPRADLRHASASIQQIGDRLFSGAPINIAAFDLHLKGTDFQLQVWQELLNIPFGKTTTYQAIANAIGRPTSTRAVGNAIGRNPVSYLIPCHRVLRSSGALGGYRWGLEQKIALLQWEKEQANPQ